eukprot:m.17122 g.17122  ORF g.17122 m.17122 type:complete len:534 (-) comp7048_c0_seq2:214-1815(-)
MASDWPKEAAAYELLHELGGDGYSSLVYEAICKSKSSHVAVKTVTPDEDMDTTKIQTDLERIQHQGRHPNLLDHYTFFHHESDLWIVMRLMDRGSVTDIIRHKEREREEDSTECVLPEEFTATVLKCTLQGLSYLHSRSHVHRALKAANILVSSSGEVMISDGGVTWQTKNKGHSGQQTCETFVGDPFWMAPEVIEQHGYNEKADIWSLGITALEMATGGAPYIHMEPMKAMMLIMEKTPPSLETIAEERGRRFTSYSADYNDFVENCLTAEPETRPSATEMLEHPFLARFARDSAYMQRELEPLPNISQLRSTQASLMRHSSIASKKRGGGGGTKKRSGRYIAKDGQWEVVDASRRRLSQINDQLHQQPDAPDRPHVVHITEPAGASAQPGHPAPAPAPASAPVTPTVAEPTSTTVSAPAPAPVFAPTAEVPVVTAATVHSFRMRMFIRGELKELSFALTIPPESPEQISEELVSEGWLRALDCAEVAGTMRKLMSGGGGANRALTFRLYGTPAEREIPAELQDGFMQIIYG